MPLHNNAAKFTIRIAEFLCFPSPPVSKMEESLCSLAAHGDLPFCISKLSDAFWYHSSLLLTPSPTEVFLIWVFREKVTSVNDCLRMILGLSPSSKSIGWSPIASLLNHYRLWSTAKAAKAFESGAGSGSSPEVIVWLKHFYCFRFCMETSMQYFRRKEKRLFSCTLSFLRTNPLVH